MEVKLTLHNVHCPWYTDLVRGIFPDMLECTAFITGLSEE